MNNGFNDQALAFFKDRGIDPEVAAELGVVLEGNTLIFPGDRRRDLNGSGPAKVRQPRGKELALWRLGEPTSAVLLTEGESDALAAECALRMAPAAADLDGIAVVSIPGAGFPTKRLADLREQGVSEAFVAIDNDDAGRNLTAKAVEVLSEAGITAIVVELPEGRDVADVLAAADDPGDLLANMLVDARAAAEEASPSIPPKGTANSATPPYGGPGRCLDAVRRACGRAPDPRAFHRGTAPDRPGG